MRLDIRLTELGLAKSRTRAQSLIAGGFVTVNGVPVTKASYDVADTDTVVLTGEEHPFVGRGGMKLDAALTRFGVDPAGLVCADIGASTGGFTDCLLRRGAEKVWAVDAGHGQLDPKLAADPRVVNCEGVNARALDPSILPEPVALAVLDLSFISQTLVLPALVTVMTPDAGYVGLIKPQFECGRDALGGGGIVRDKKQHTAAIRKVLAALDAVGLGAVDLMKSPVRGGDGNTEFLVYARRGIPRAVGERETAEAVQAKE